MPDYILLIIGDNLFAIGAKIDQTLYYKPLYLAWYFLPLIPSLFSRRGQRGGFTTGLYATITAIISVEIEQGLAFDSNPHNYFGLLDIAAVLVPLFIIHKIVQTRFNMSGVEGRRHKRRSQ